MNGRISSRFEIEHHIEGLIDTEPTLQKAKNHALKWAMSNTGYPDAIQQVRIYDVMAQVGNVNKWGYEKSAGWVAIGQK